MTPQHTLRRQDQPIQIGPRHGYRIEGDHVVINAELQIPPYHSGGEWTLELWATDQPHREGPLTGAKIAELALELPTPIGPYVHQVDTRTVARLPPQGRPYAMVLALVEQGPDGGEVGVHAFANYAEPQTFSAPHFEGSVGYVLEGQEVVLKADGIVNPRSSANLSGTLSLELWAFPESSPSTEGLRLAAAEIEQVAGQGQLGAIERRASFNEPPAGRFQLALLLCEWTFAHGYVVRDRRDFSRSYQHPAPELPDSSPAAVSAPTRPVERLRLIPTVKPEVAATEPEAAARPEVAVQPERAVVAAAVEAPSTSEAPASVAIGHSVKPSLEVQRPDVRGPVSIQTGSVEELARVKGLNLKIAKEIIKGRPFMSLADLIRVRGLGQKTIDRLKGLVTL